MKHSPYARIVSKTGPGNEYDYHTDDYYVGVCDTCGIETESMGLVGGGGLRGHFERIKAREDWVKDHNAKYHPNSSEIPLCMPTIEMTLTCGHIYGENANSLGVKPGQRCGRQLMIYRDGFEFNKATYICGAGHHNKMPQKLPNNALEKVISRKNERLKENHRQYKIDQKIEKLKKEKKS